MSQSLLYDENNFLKNVTLEVNVKTPHGSDIGCFMENDFSYPDKVKIFLFFPEKKN